MSTSPAAAQSTASQSEHVPGPWKMVWIEPPLVAYAGWFIKRDDDVQFPIAFVTQTIGGRRSPQEANARLIVAAPDLLQAAKDAAALLLELQADLPELKYTINAALGPLHTAIGRAEGKV